MIVNAQLYALIQLVGDSYSYVSGDMFSLFSTLSRGSFSHKSDKTAIINKYNLKFVFVVQNDLYCFTSISVIFRYSNKTDEFYYTHFYIVLRNILCYFTEF